ncbi:uncharacterized protein LOC127812927 [Diospyros lotus]|uniref:uncharacterized protein LOC127812927 n=1 Tax=Diospyros lotus TaxID=55363 RepID=UPI00224D3788|nr:uncharacterized protein LOC127812927 [Diospyros lotus]
MESRAGKSGGVENPRKTRSLDLDSLYKSSDSRKEGNSRGKSGGEDDDDDRKKKRKSRKEVSLSSFELAGKKSRISADEIHTGGTSSGSPESGRLQLGLNQELDNNGGFNSISLNLDGDGNLIQIPKRRRDFVGRKKFKSNQVSKSAGQSSSGASGSVDQIAKLNGECKKLEANESQERLLNSDGKASSMDQIAKLRGDSSGKTVSPKVKGELGLDESKKSRTRMGNSARQGKEENGHLIVSHGDSSSKKCHSNRRKRKDLASGDKGIANKVEPMVDGAVKTHGDFQEEDEENLEQNAARMLSSRFDPSCTGFSSKSKSPGSPSTDGLSFFIPSNENFVGRGANSLARLESASVDTASRVLRPRNGHREKGLLRKRRHFYEILPRDLDAYWVLNRRIKVFWPLDESWYYGLVSDYDPERKLHHIKYDDRDEEWINLQSERFKLLLLPGEVPCRTEQKRATVGNKQDDKEKSDLTTDDDSFMGGCTDSEPIISWLARSSLRIKSSPLGVSKRRKISHLSPNFVSYKLSTRTDEAHGSMDVGPSENDIKKPPCSSALSDRSTDACGGKKFLQEGTNISKDCKFPVVYFRRRFRKKDEALCKARMDNHAHGSLSVSVTSLASVVQGSQGSREYGISIGRVEPEGLLWSLDVSGSLRLNIPLVISKQFRYELVSLPLLWYRFGLENSWLLRALLFLQHGTLMTTWPMVQLEILFVDNNVGLRLLLFEGGLKQAVAFVFLVLTLFGQPIERGKYVDTQMPVTSIRFGLSSVEDHRKHRVFAFYSFSKVKFSKWLYLDHKLQRHCLLTRKLHLSECTYDNIKTLVCSTGSQCSEFEVLQKKSMGTEPIGLLRDFHGAAMNQASSDSYVKHGILIPFALSFGAAPSFFINLHLKLLMENVASISFGDHDSTCSLENSEKSICPVVDDCTQIQVDSESVSEMTPEGNPGNSVMGAASSESLPSAKSQLGTEILSEFNDGGHAQDFQNGSLNVAGTSTCSSNPGDYVMVQSQKRECSSEELEQQVVASPKPVVPNGHTSLDISDTRSYSGLSIEIPLLDQIERPAGGEMPCAPESADRAWYVRDRFVHGPNPTGPRSMWHRNRNSSSSPMGSISHGWPDGQAEYLRNGFGNGPKRPRTQVQYTLPFGGVDVNSKHKIHNQRGLPYQRIRKANEKRPSDVSRNAHRNLELLVCDANILITTGDRGWREHGARVVLELADHNEWRLAVKLSGTTKYSYKAYQFLQPGSTNRYTHAMMWKGGKDWVLEFPDRSQWMLFKEMHEECYNRNIRAASVKNIPIPGVRLVEETDDSGTEVPLVRSSPKYFRQVETDVDMALNPSCVLYDMDSDDERWISENQECSPGQEKEISENLFEKTMDMFEKLAYARQCDHFTTDEIEELMVGLGPMEAIEVIYQYWQLKRQRNGMPLIRHLQPPLWERYELQLKEWEQKMAKANSAIFNGCHEKALPLDKPPMFAFCLKPRGLEVPNKGSKQRSQRRFPTGHSHTVLGDQDGSHAFGRRLNGFSFGDEKVLHGTSYDSSEASPLFQASARVFSPREASGSGHFSLSNDWSEWNHHPKLHRNKSKKIGAFLSPNNAQTVALYNQRSVGKRNGVHWWNMGLPEWPSQKHYQSEGSLRHGIEQLDSSDLDEFRLRDASGAAQHALNMAKLKREKAQRLVYRADLAIHKAVVTLMTAEAIKAAFENSKE